jgi:hypothetical protein
LDTSSINTGESDFRIAVLDGQKIYYDNRDPNSIFFKFFEYVWRKLDKLTESIDELNLRVDYLYENQTRDYNED